MTNLKIYYLPSFKYCLSLKKFNFFVRKKNVEAFHDVVALLFRRNPDFNVCSNDGMQQ